MQHILNYNKKSKKILKHIRNDIEELIEINEKNNKNVDNIKKSVKNIQFELSKLDAKFEDNDSNESFVTAKILSENVEDIFDIPIKKQILIRKIKGKRCKSFSSWLFSNKDI